MREYELIILIWAQGKGKKGSKGKGKRSCEDSAFECGILGGEQGMSTLLNQPHEKM